MKVSGVFDRVTVGQSVYRRLKDDVIKMLSRTEKFGVKVIDASEHEIVRKDENATSLQGGDDLPASS